MKPIIQGIVFLVTAVLSLSGADRAGAQSALPLWVPENGWYGELVPGTVGGPLGDRGRGVYFETQGSIGVVTVMTYETDGRPVMLYAAGAVQTGVACVGLSTSEFTQFVTCIRNAELFRISGGVPLGGRGVPAQPPRTAEVVGRIELQAGHDFMRLSIHPPNPSLPPPGVWPDQMRLQRLQWGYGGFGGNLPIGGGLSGTALLMPGACIPDFRGDWVLVEPANRSREARRLVFDQLEQLDPNFNCGLVATPEDAARIFVIFRDSQRQVELRCRASGCGYWDQGVYVGWVPRGYELKRFSVAVGVPDGGQIPQFPRAGRLVAYRVE
jgi:hypothetical protein